MNELKQQLIAKLGVDEATADSAIEMVLGFVKEKLPENMQGMVDSALAEDGEGNSTADSAIDAVKGFFG